MTSAVAKDKTGQVWAHVRDEWRIYLLLWRIDGLTHEEYKALNLHTGELRTFAPTSEEVEGWIFERLA